MDDEALLARWDAGASLSREEEDACKALLKSTLPSRGEYKARKRARAETRTALLALWNSGAPCTREQKRACKALFASSAEYKAAKRHRRDVIDGLVARWTAGEACSAEEKRVCKAMLKSKTDGAYKAARRMRKAARRRGAAATATEAEENNAQSAQEQFLLGVEGVRSWKEDPARVYKKGRWTSEEDVVLLEAVLEHASELRLEQADVVAYVSSNRVQRAERFSPDQLRALGSLWELVGRSVPARSLKQVSHRAHTLLVPKTAVAYTPYSDAELAVVRRHLDASQNGKVDYVLLEQQTGRPRKSLTSIVSRLRKRGAAAAST